MNPLIRCFVAFDHEAVRAATNEIRRPVRRLDDVAVGRLSDDAADVSAAEMMIVLTCDAPGRRRSQLDHRESISGVVKGS